MPVTFQPAIVELTELNDCIFLILTYGIVQKY